MRPIPIIDPDLPYFDDLPADASAASQRSPLDLSSSALAAIVATTLLWFCAAGVLVWTSLHRSSSSGSPGWFETGPIVPLTIAFGVASLATFVLAVGVEGRLRRLRCGLISFLAASVAVFFGLRFGDAIGARWLVLPCSYLVGTAVPRLLPRLR